MRIPVTIDRTVETPALIDSGAGGMFIDEQFARDNNIALTPLINHIPVYNVDGTQNKQGVITHYAWRELSVAGITRRTRLLATSLRKEAIILGLPWLRKVNPQIDWTMGKVTMPEPIPKAARVIVEEVPDDDGKAISIGGVTVGDAIIEEVGREQGVNEEVGDESDAEVPPANDHIGGNGGSTVEESEKQPQLCSIRANRTLR